jgi:hypothetical protein
MSWASATLSADGPFGLQTLEPISWRWLNPETVMRRYPWKWAKAGGEKQVDTKT